MTRRMQRGRRIPRHHGGCSARAEQRGAARLSRVALEARSMTTRRQHAGGVLSVFRMAARAARRAARLQTPQPAGSGRQRHEASRSTWLALGRRALGARSRPTTPGSVENGPPVVCLARNGTLRRARGAEAQRAWLPRRASAARQSRLRQVKSLATLAAARRRVPRRNARYPAAADANIVRARGLRRAERVRGGAQARRSDARALPVRLWRHPRALLRP